MFPRHLSLRVIGHVATLVGSVLVSTFLMTIGIDWFGYEPVPFCLMWSPPIITIYGISVLLTSLGVVLLVVSVGRSDTGMTLALGGMLLFALSFVMMNYLSVACGS